MAAVGMQPDVLTRSQTTLTVDKPRIPLVAHIITDDDIGMLQGSKLQPINLGRVIKLLTDPHSAILYDRHVNSLQRLIRHYQNGFPMKDLVQVFKLLNVCADRVDQQPLYESPIIEILNICSLPYLKEKTSDEIVYEQIVIESISQLGYLMRVPSNNVRKTICQTLMSFYSEEQTKQKVQKHKASTKAYNQRVIENSDVSETLIKSLALMENDGDVRLMVLDVLQKLSKGSEKTCNQMLLADGARRICSRLMDPGPSGHLLFQSVEIMWNLLENGDRENLAAQLNNVVCISQLRDAFVYQLTQGYSHYDRQLRNDLITIATLVVTRCPDSPFVECGFARQLVLFGTFQEVKSHNALVKHLKLMTNQEDFELKKLLMNILVKMATDSTMIPLMSEGHLLLALFSYVRNNEKSVTPREWTPAQFEELQLHALSCLTSLCPVMIEDYMTCQGNTRLLLLLEWCVGPDEFSGQGNSFHGTGGRGNKKSQMSQCLRLLRSVVSTEDELVLQDMADQGAINQLIGILKTAFTSSPLENHMFIDIEMQTDILIILSSLCEGDIHRKELFGRSGVDIVINYLKTDSRLLNSGLGHHRLLLASVDAAWCAIVGCFLTEDYFLERSGVFLLFDLLELVPKSMYNLILGCLLDLCENPKTMNHVLTWRGKDNSTAAHLLCHIWRNEDLDVGALRESTGAIAGIGMK
ncbi:cilia- and flagella-associated protein 69 [Patella vulgata]|uniref:cilia- and flagella-associated protein 69 n=1 Tax=Patella vulgata TaxID=6465 RepID=UPI002180697E|nr:cilia- and flagella-associated protein 69 [Patella vulgata]